MAFLPPAPLARRGRGAAPAVSKKAGARARPRAHAPVAVFAGRGSGGASDGPAQAAEESQAAMARDTKWPVWVVNTVVNTCPQGERLVVERFGRLHRIRGPGLFLGIPLVDAIRFRVDMRERTLHYPPQLAITKDNVSVEVSACLFFQFVDAEKACYGAANPLVAVLELAKSAMRSCVGELELDDLFHSRKRVNEQVCEALQTPATDWGMVVKRHEILDVRTDDRIAEAMDRQAAAERVRRERVIQAEGKKEFARIESEGERIRLQNLSEGDRVRVENEARAAAEAVRLQAEANASAIDTMAHALNTISGRDAAQLAVARDYIAMYGEIGKKSNTIMMGENAASVASLMAQAAVAVEAAKGAVEGGGTTK